MAEDDDVLEDAVTSGDDGDGEELDPLAEDMLKMMKEM